MPNETANKKLNAKLRTAKSKSALRGLQGSGELEDWKKARQMVKPFDQVPLSDTELKEEITRVLTCTDPLQPNNLVKFNYAQGCFVPNPSTSNTIILLDITGCILHKDTEEAKKQIALMGTEFPECVEEEEEVKQAIPEEQVVESAEKEEAQEDEEEEGEGGDVEPETKVDEDEEAEMRGMRGKKLTNQFNFCERAALTFNNPCRSQETQTIPPPRATFSSLVLQWIIHDAYQEDYETQQKEKEREKKLPMAYKKVITVKKKRTFEGNEKFEARLLAAWKTLERMVTLNAFDDIAKDYRYWEDPADEFRDEEGTLLPLWKFTYEKTKKNTVTDIMWNPWYYDLFAVCFGSLNCMEQLPGAVCLFSIKNPSYPEYICLTDNAVMCIDIHRQHPFMVVIGLYNGSVFIYNASVNCKHPQYRSNSVANKHSGIVWKVRWGPNLQDGEMNFYSVGSDGKINNWILMQNELSLTTIITLTFDQDPLPGPDGTFIKLKGSASCLTFHPNDPLIYFVGTEEGFIYKCSTLYSSTYLFTYNAHHMPVYQIHFNLFNAKIFASCSGDWRVKIWEEDRPKPLFVFDFGSSVADVKWAPYSSTVFANTTATGRVHVFDLNINKYKAICRQNVVSKKKNILTRLTFNKKLPILIVGDDKGCIHTLKLSPNLRIPCKPPKKQQHLDQFTMQCMKLEKLLALVREPPTLSPPDDIETVTDT